MSSIDAALSLGLAIWLGRKILRYLEFGQFWTLRLRLSTVQHPLTITSLVLIWMLTLQALLSEFPEALHQFRFSISLFCTVGILITLFDYILPARRNHDFFRLQWKAWCGPSRTGIRTELVRYIGDLQDWKSLERSNIAKVELHPIERYSRVPIFSQRHIAADPTNILIAQESSDKENGTLWVPQSKVARGVYQPILPGKSASLLWGEHIGFQRRCSRAIMAVPKYLLSPTPRLVDGVDARGLCIAYGILARNKGLNPTSFICNLYTKGMINVFEEQSVYWPRPSKTLRSIFHRECKRYYSGLGDTFIIFATELALLLTDAPTDIVEDWLDARLEHQDLDLNITSHALGAQVQELEILYRGHYAAMLVSLSSHRLGIRIRPEVLIYDAICRSLDIDAGTWAKSAVIQNRRRQELQVIGPRVMHLIDSVI